jgi:hypothetical protein
MVVDLHCGTKKRPDYSCKEGMPGMNQSASNSLCREHAASDGIDMKDVAVSVN